MKAIGMLEYCQPKFTYIGTNHDVGTPPRYLVTDRWGWVQKKLGQPRHGMRGLRASRAYKVWLIGRQHPKYSSRTARVILRSICRVRSKLGARSSRASRISIEKKLSLNCGAWNRGMDLCPRGGVKCPNLLCTKKGFWGGSRFFLES